MSTNQTNTPDKKILDFTAFKNKKEVNSEFSRARKPLYVNNDEGRVSGTAQGAKADASNSSSEDFGDRLQKIRASLDRINTLMTDLKKLSAHREKDRLN